MSAKVNPNSIVPMYKQVLNILTEQIKNGELKHGDKLPSEAELMKQYGVSRITIRGAIAELVEEGILERSQGKGTFVATPKELYTAKDDFGFTRSCILSGKKPSTKLLSKEMIYPSQNDMEYFQIRETDKILCTKRLRFVAVSYTHLRAHETVLDLVCRLLLEKKKYNSIRRAARIHNTVH